MIKTLEIRFPWLRRHRTRAIAIGTIAVMLGGWGIWNFVVSHPELHLRMWTLDVASFAFFCWLVFLLWKAAYRPGS